MKHEDIIKALVMRKAEKDNQIDLNAYEKGMRDLSQEILRTNPDKGHLVIIPSAFTEPGVIRTRFTTYYSKWPGCVVEHNTAEEYVNELNRRIDAWMELHNYIPQKPLENWKNSLEARPQNTKR
jgi:hypothetical protein